MNSLRAELLRLIWPFLARTATVAFRGLFDLGFAAVFLTGVAFVVRTDVPVERFDVDELLFADDRIEEREPFCAAALKAARKTRTKAVMNLRFSIDNPLSPELRPQRYIRPDDSSRIHAGCSLLAGIGIDVDRNRHWAYCMSGSGKANGDGVFESTSTGSR